MIQNIKKLMGAVLMASICATSLWAQNTVQTVDQVTGTVTITEPIDSVIPNTTPFTTAGSIDIQNPDATVIFQNIRPSVVINSYLRKVKANGVTLVNNGNCRVSIYLHGAIVMPHSDTKSPDGTDFYPLTVYTGDNFTGDSYQYNGDARQTSGPWVDTMRSFKLKRGYMLTVANMPNGTGYSHCYIANHKDIEVQLRAELAGKVGFFRIFRWQWPSKKGTCDVGPNDFNATWHYNWGAGRTSETNYEYVPQRHHEAGNSNGEGWKGAWESWDNINASDGTCTHVLGQNEPDNTGGAKEVYTYVTEIPENPRENCATTTLTDHAAEFLYSGKRIGTFACCNPNTGWVSTYVNWCRENNIRVDFVATHYYIGGQSPQGCIDRLWSLHNVTGLPVWATEWNNGANWSGESGFTTESEGWYTWGSGNDSKKNGEWLTAVLARADRPENAWLERLAVYNAVETKREVWTNGAISEGGKIYKAYNSTFAYDDKNEYFMPWNHKAPTDLKATLLASDKKANLVWKNNNGKQTDSIHIERKLTGGRWTSIASLYKPSSTTLSYQDNLQEAEGLVSYRIRNYDSDRTQRTSGEATVTVAGTSGSAFLQYGIINMADEGEKAVTFNYEMDEKPAVFFGLASYNNGNLVMEPYIKNSAITSTGFTFTPIKWRKQSKTGTFKNKETLPFMAIPFGNYHFDGMDIEVGSLPIKADTLDVAFKEPFSEGVTPIVIASSNGTTDTTRPLMHKVWNITNTGFRCVVMYEDGEINTRGKHIVPSVTQYLSYIAVTPGDACVDPTASTYLAAGYGQTAVVTNLPSDEYFEYTTGNTEEEAVTDTLHLLSPVIFCDNQTLNLPTPAVFRNRGTISTTGIDPDTQMETTYTIGFKVRRIVDESVTSGINTAQSGTADQVAWIALHTNPATTPTAIQQPVIESTYTGNELNVRVENHIIYVEGYPQFDLFTSNGTRAASNATQAPGVYIVRAGGKVAKVVVK